MTFSENATKFVKANFSKIKYLQTISIHERRQRGGIRRGLIGLYILKDHYSDTVYYVGQTMNCISNRISNHLMSLKNPLMKRELTGLMFKAAKIPLDSKMDVLFISSEDLGIITRDEYVSTETMFKIALKAKANAFRCRH